MTLLLPQMLVTGQLHCSPIPLLPLFNRALIQKCWLLNLLTIFRYETASELPLLHDDDAASDLR